MSFKVNETAVQFAQRALEAVREQEDSVAQLRTFTVCISEETITILDYVSSKLRLSRTVLAEELLCRAAQEVLAVVGQPSEEEGSKLIVPPKIDAARRTRKAAGLYDSKLHNPKRKVKAINRG